MITEKNRWKAGVEKPVENVENPWWKWICNSFVTFEIFRTGAYKTA
jgi:hypothetical protein